MRMKAWAIDVYGLREAHRRSVLGRLRDAHRLYVSPLTWFPGNGKSSRRTARRAPGNLTLIGAMQKFDADTAISIKCGGSEVVITGDGVTISSPMVTFTSGKTQLPKPAAEGG